MRNRRDRLSMGCKVGQLERAAEVEVRCLVGVFLIVAIVDGVLAAVESVVWPIAVAGICVAGALALERLVLVHGSPDGPGRDAARRILKEGLAALPGADLAETGGRRPWAGARRR